LGRQAVGRTKKEDRQAGAGRCGAKAKFKYRAHVLAGLQGLPS